MYFTETDALREISQLQMGTAASKKNRCVFFCDEYGTLP